MVEPVLSPSLTGAITNRSPGKLANILVVDGRPDKSISQTRNVDAVILLGKFLDRKKLKFDEKKDPGFQVRK